MISDFIYKYYIDPIKTGQAYNVVDTLTYAIILVIGVYLLYRWMSSSTYLAESGFSFDRTFILATVPYVILGGLLRVIEDTGMITSDWKYLLDHPPDILRALLFCHRHDVPLPVPDPEGYHERILSSFTHLPAAWQSSSHPSSCWPGA